MESLRKRLLKSEERINYLLAIKDTVDWGNLSGFQEKYRDLAASFYDYSEEELATELRKLEDGLAFLEERCDSSLTAMERVRIEESSSMSWMISRITALISCLFITTNPR